MYLAMSPPKSWESVPPLLENTQAKEKSNLFAMRPDRDFTILTHTVEKGVKSKHSCTVESLAQNKSQTSTDKLNISKNDIQEQKSSKILAQDLTTKEKDLKPYWNDVCSAISSKLWLPTGIDFADSATEII